MSMTQRLFDFGIKAALESYGTWGIYLRHCPRVRFDLYPGHTFSRHYVAKVATAIRSADAYVPLFLTH